MVKNRNRNKTPVKEIEIREPVALPGPPVKEPVTVTVAPNAQKPTETATCDHALVGVTRQRKESHCMKCGKVM